jgi:hypothetical protein
VRASHLLHRHPHPRWCGTAADPRDPQVGDLDLPATAELDMLVRDLARTVEAHAGPLTVSDGTGEVVEVLGTWGDAMGPEAVTTYLTDRFPGRALASERAALERSQPARRPVDASIGVAQCQRKASGASSGEAPGRRGLTRCRGSGRPGRAGTSARDGGSG